MSMGAGSSSSSGPDRSSPACPADGPSAPDRSSPACPAEGLSGGGIWTDGAKLPPTPLLSGASGDLSEAGGEALDASWPSQAGSIAQTIIIPKMRPPRAGDVMRINAFALGLSETIPRFSIQFELRSLSTEWVRRPSIIDGLFTQEASRLRVWPVVIGAGGS